MDGDLNFVVYARRCGYTIGTRRTAALFVVSARRVQYDHLRVRPDGQREDVQHAGGREWGRRRNYSPPE